MIELPNRQEFYKEPNKTPRTKGGTVRPQPEHWGPTDLDAIICHIAHSICRFSSFLEIYCNLYRVHACADHLRNSNSDRLCGV